MVKHKPFTRTEMKILIFNKVKNGMSYEKACKELEKEIDSIIANDVKFDQREKRKKYEESAEKKKKIKENKKFKDNFAKITNGKKR